MRQSTKTGLLSSPLAKQQQPTLKAASPAARTITGTAADTDSASASRDRCWFHTRAVYRRRRRARRSGTHGNPSDERKRDIQKPQPPGKDPGSRSIFLVPKPETRSKSSKPGRDVFTMTITHGGLDGQNSYY